jgi:hypothetical protein
MGPFFALGGKKIENAESAEKIRRVRREKHGDIDICDRTSPIRRVKMSVVGTILTGSFSCQEDRRVQRTEQTRILEIIGMRSRCGWRNQCGEGISYAGSR